MRKAGGIFCLVLGFLLLFSAVGLVLYNRYEDSHAGEQADLVLEDLKEELPDTGAEEKAEEEKTEEGSADLDETADPSMKVKKIGQYTYIGYLTIPALGLELPVMEDWDYTRLKTAPCRYYGSRESGDLVIAAHNYLRHFGKLKDQQPGSEVYFTDMGGNVYGYEIESVEILDPYAVTEMLESEFDLTLFTCTYGGQERVTVRCNRTDG